MRVLAVEVDEATRPFRQNPHRHRPPINVGPSTARPGHHPAEDNLDVTDDEPSVNASLVSSRAHEGGVGTCAEEQLDGLDDEGLSRAGLPGDHRHAVTKNDGCVMDNTEVGDDELSEHDDPGRPSGRAP